MNIAATIDHTLLKPDATRADVERLCAEAVSFGFFSVCVNGSRVALARTVLDGRGPMVAAVTGFPLGAMEPAAKATETGLAVAAGADEIDTVLNVGWLLDGDHAGVLGDLQGVVAAADGRPVKVILETGLLTDVLKRTACLLAVEAGAAFVKTSTGFAGSGATVDDVRLMKSTVGDACQVKASGGIRDRATALAMLAAGATRLGTSSGAAIVRGDDAGATGGTY